MSEQSSTPTSEPNAADAAVRSLQATLRAEQVWFLRALSWYLDPEGRNCGRSYLTAVILLSKALQTPGFVVSLVDHYPGQHGVRVVQDEVAQLIRLPALSAVREYIRVAEGTVVYDPTGALTRPATERVRRTRGQGQVSPISSIDLDDIIRQVTSAQAQRSEGENGAERERMMRAFDEYQRIRRSVENGRNWDINSSMFGLLDGGPL